MDWRHEIYDIDADELRSKRTALLIEAISSYNVNNLCIAEDKRSRYYLEGKEDIIGKRIEDIEKLKKWDTIPINPATHPEIWPHLPADLKILGGNFLNRIQSLTSNPNLWNENGLSRIGHMVVSEIKIKYNLSLGPI